MNPSYPRYFGIAFVFCLEKKSILYINFEDLRDSILTDKHILAESGFM